MAETCAQGVFGRMLVKKGSPPYTWTSGALRVPFYRHDLKRTGRIVNPNVILGTRSKNASRSRKGPNRYAGNIMVPVSPGDMATLLELALGATPVGTTYNLAETIPAFGALIDNVTGVFEYQSCFVDKMLIYGEQNGADENAPPNYVTCVLSVLAKGENGPNTVAFPSVDFTEAPEFTPFTIEDSRTGVVLFGATRKIKKFWLLIDNHLQERRVNDLDPTTICPSGRTVALRTVHPYDDDHDDLYNVPTAGASGSITFTNGTISTSASFANLQAPPVTPFVSGFTEIDITLDMVAYKSGSTPEVTFTNDATP